RFGTILPRRLNQALGFAPEIFVCERLKEPLSITRDWEIPIDDRLALAHLCRIMLRDLLSIARRLGMGLQEMEGQIQTEAGPVEIVLSLVTPSCNEQHLVNLIDLQLERIAWSGGVVACRLTATRLGYLEQSERSWFEDESQFQASKAFHNLID